MKRPQSRAKRLAVAALSLWVAASIAFVLFNRYRYGGDFDGLTDLVLLAFAAPLAGTCLVLGCFCLGARGTAYLAGAALLAIGAEVGVSGYSAHLAHQARNKEAAAFRARQEALERRYGAECRDAKGGKYSYVICISEKESAEARKHLEQ